jgi:CRP-like cAMP-binding protein
LAEHILIEAPDTGCGGHVIGHPESSAVRLLPNGTTLVNRLLRALPHEVYQALAADLRVVDVRVGDVLHKHDVPVQDVYFPNGGVFSVTNQMLDGRLVEVATVGTEGMLGVSVFLGDHRSIGQALLQVPEGSRIDQPTWLPAMSVTAFARHTATSGPLRDIVARYAQAILLQVMQCTACNALHLAEERCCRWLLQTHDRIGRDEFLLRHEFLAIMLGVTRPTVTLIMGTLQKSGLISNHYGRIRVLDRKSLEAASCECYHAIVGHFERLSLTG